MNGFLLHNKFSVISNNINQMEADYSKLFIQDELSFLDTIFVHASHKIQNLMFIQSAITHLFFELKMNKADVTSACIDFFGQAKKWMLFNQAVFMFDRSTPLDMVSFRELL